jgi:CelD/BcsL family acetyltransferase involved in cellulose biosynthesis
VSGGLLGPRFERVEWTGADSSISSMGSDAPSRNLFQTNAWLHFLAEVQRAEPVAAVLRDGSQELGHFTGLIVRRWGFRFLGSPLPGWTTPYMGFDLRPGVPRRLAVTALIDFAFRDLRCIHLELRDRWLGEHDVEELGFGRRRDVGYDDRTFEIDLRQSEDEIFGRMESACRRCIRQADKRGVTIEEATDLDFADEFYAHLTEVFLRQGLVPTYGVERVRALIRHLQPAGQLLLLRARDAEGRCIATGIYPAFGETALFWGGASLRAYQQNRPNEALHWYAMRYWKARGVARYDLGGFMEYKRKYGGEEVSIPGFRRSSSPVISALRTLAPRGMRTKQQIIGKLRQRQLVVPYQSPAGAAGD